MTLLLLLACASSPDLAAQAEPALSAASTAPAAASDLSLPVPAGPELYVPPAPTGSPDELPELHGQTDVQILAHMGPPTSKEILTLGDCCSEYDIELYNTYPPNSGHDDLEIARWTWQYDGYTVAIWLHQVEGTWIVLNSVRYSARTEF